ncbi:MAG: PTS sugar transporter subunit IIA [Polyangiaceae bacterium]
MRLSDVLTAGRILVDSDGGFVHAKVDAIRILSSMLASAVGASKEDVERLLTEREQLQSTGIGDGVAIPHASLESATIQAGALLLCPKGVPFESIDGEHCHIVFGVVGPRRATGEHLKLLARISRLLRDGAMRQRLVESANAEAAFALIREQDEAMSVG